jgi:hypothetical protein
MKLKERHFEAASDIQSESKAVLDSSKEKITFTVILKRGENGGIALCVPNETAAKME